MVIMLRCCVLLMASGGAAMTAPPAFGRMLLDAALKSPLYKLLLVPQARSTMVKTAEANGVPWR